MRRRGEMPLPTIALWGPTHRARAARKAPEVPREPGVYFIVADELARVKIGYSADLRKRLVGCSMTESPCALRLVGWFVYPSQDDAFRAEQEHHARWKRSRVHGEWFRIGRDLARTIAEAARHAWGTEHDVAAVEKWTRAEREPETPGFLYAVRGADGAIKFGFTGDIARRLSELKKPAYGHGRVTLLAQAAGTMQEEMRLHRRLMAHAIDGEWYRETPEVQAAVEDLRARTGRRARAGGRLTFQGITDTVPGWARRLGVCRISLTKRLLRGWTVERTLTEPSQRSRKRADA